MQKASIALIKELKKQKRENRFLLFLDNAKIINDAIAKGLQPLYLLVADEKFNLWESQYPTYKIDQQTLKQLSDSVTPQGVVCVAEYIQNSLEKPKGNFLVLDGLQDPGNVGSLIRTACACDIEYVYLVDSVHVTNSKLIRSSVGTVFDIHVIEIDEKTFIKKALEWQLHLIKADMAGENIFQKKFKHAVGIVVGNEGQGVGKNISELCQDSVSIPMKRGVESLNAAISGSIIMYSIAHQQNI